MGKLLALDVGGRRIGVAEGDEETKIAYPTTTITVDGSEIHKLEELIHMLQPVKIIVGFPRNQQGEPTQQTDIVKAFVERLHTKIPTIFQDESLTSVVAEQRLRDRGKPYTKEMIDAEAAALILQDYLEIPRGY